MKALRRLLVIAMISLVLSLVLSSCRTVEKAAISCPEFSGNKNNTVVAHHKKNRNKTLATYYRINISQHRGGRVTILSRRNLRKESAEVENFPGKQDVMISDKEHLNDLSKVEYINRLTASTDNSIIPSGRANSISFSLKKREIIEHKEELTNSQQFGCDTLFLKSGSFMVVKITEIGQNEIRYRICDSLSGSINSILKSDLSVIKYSTGNRDFFTSTDAVNLSDKKEKTEKEPVGVAGFILSLINILNSLKNTVPLGIPGLGLIQIFLGIISLVRIKRHPDKYKGKGFAIVSILTGIIFSIILFVFVIVVNNQT